MILKPELLVAVQAVDARWVHLYWHIGQLIVEEEQQGADRAAYGTFLVQGLADTLQPQFGSGFSRRQLYWYVQFYGTFPIVSAVRTQSALVKSLVQKLSGELSRAIVTHYLNSYLI